MARPKSFYPTTQQAASLPRPMVVALRMLSPTSPGRIIEYALLKLFREHPEKLPRNLSAHMMNMAAGGPESDLRCFPAILSDCGRAVAELRGNVDPHINPVNLCNYCGGAGTDASGYRCPACKGDGYLFVPDGFRPLNFGERQKLFGKAKPWQTSDYSPTPPGEPEPVAYQDTDHAQYATASPSVPPIPDTQDTTNPDQDTGDDDTLTI